MASPSTNAHVGPLQGAQGLDHAVFLQLETHLRLASDAGGVDEQVIFIVDAQRHIDGVARRAGDVRNDQSLIADEPIDQGAFAHIRLAHDGDTRLLRRLDGLFLRRLRIVGKIGQHLVHQIFDAHLFLGGDHIELLGAKLVELGGVELRLLAFDFVDGVEDGLVDLAQALGDVLVLGHQALANIHQEDDDVRLFDGEVDLLDPPARSARLAPPGRCRRCRPVQKSFAPS